MLAGALQQMVQILAVLPCLFVCAVGVAPPVVVPIVSPPVRSAAMPSSGPATNLARASGVAPTTAAYAPGLRGQLPHFLAPSIGWKVAEDKLMDIFGSTSRTLASMYYESEVLRLPRVANGGPSIDSLLDILESAMPLSSRFDKDALVADWRLEFTNDLPANVRQDIAQHQGDNLADVSVSSSISKAGIMDTTSVLSFVDGGTHAVKSQTKMMQIGSSPFFSIDGQGRESTSMQITYMSDSLIVLRKYSDGESQVGDVQATSGQARPAQAFPRTEVWSKIKQRPEAHFDAGVLSLWRFGLPYEIPREAQVATETSVKSAISFPGLLAFHIDAWKLALGSFLLFASTAFVAGQRHRMKATQEAADTVLTHDWSSRARFAVAAMASKTGRKKKKQRLSLADALDREKKEKEAVAKGLVDKKDVAKLAPEQTFWEGPPSSTECLVPFLASFLVLGIVPFIASVNRQFRVKYKITDRRVSVTGGWDGKDVTEFSYAEIKEMKYGLRWAGYCADVRISLRDGAKVELFGLLNFFDNYEYIFSRVEADCRKRSDPVPSGL